MVGKEYVGDFVVVYYVIVVLFVCVVGEDVWVDFVES